MKVLKVPKGLIGVPYYHNALTLNGLSIVESCTHTQKSKTGSMFLEDHLLLFVLEGRMTINYGKTSYTVHKNEMVLLKKSINIEYDKIGNPGNNDIYDSVMFFLKDEFLLDFIKLTGVSSTQTIEMAKVSVKPVKERLEGYVASIKPYFTQSDNIDGSLIRLKMLELLHDISDTDQNLLLQLLQLKTPVQTDIKQIIEENYMNPVSLTDLAYLSGRSLSSFKRDFHTVYLVPPAQWIREKRLAKAKELLIMTDMAVKDVCYATGFEDLANFSRLYKSYFGNSPSAERISMTS
ncbi:MAG TPA: AraC family transcriptional regulator [Pedobacter sp.]